MLFLRVKATLQQMRVCLWVLAAAEVAAAVQPNFSVHLVMAAALALVIVAEDILNYIPVVV